MQRPASLHHSMFGLVAVCLALLTGCTQPQTGNDAAAKVSIRLKWLVQTQSAGELLAVAKGYCTQERLECDVQAGGPDFDAIKLVASGVDQYGVTSADQLLIARAKGVPVVAIGALFHESPVVFFSKADTPLRSPADLAGRTVGVKHGTNAETEYRVLLRRANVDPSSITEVPAKFDLTPFLTGAVDVWPGIESNEPLTAEEKGVKVSVLRSRDHGISMYSNVYFTTEERVNARPDEVRRFIKAMRAGWQYAADHPEEAVDVVLAANPALDRVHEGKALELTLPLVFPDGADSFGAMTEHKWAATMAVLRDGGILTADIDLSKAYWQTDAAPPQ
ncbi:MAG TPA: ABC transporter substrate-binding protein [Thermoanaerobaculia bacterium]|nr:ABC transporter substrate-binding protein [Thermoanaerobaculia bacterium]